MKRQQSDDIIKFLKDNIEPLEDSAYGPGYRASAHLTDGTFLPCVIFRNPKTLVDLAIKRFKEVQTGKSIFKSNTGNDYHDIIKTFVAKGNCINDYDIHHVDKSRFVFPSSIEKLIRGETTMSWTGFAARMKDGKYIGFGTSFRTEFFDLPDGYTTEDIEEIVNHSYVLDTGELRSHRKETMTFPEEYKKAVVYRDRPFFECYLDYL